jgi:hypothetical protein
MFGNFWIEFNLKVLMEFNVWNPFGYQELNSQWNSISKNTIKEVNQRSTCLIYNIKEEKFNVKINFSKILIFLSLFVKIFEEIR